MVDLTDVFEDGPENWTGPPLTEAMVVAAEHALGIRLPTSYVDLLRYRNGGVLRRNCFATGFATYWAHDHFSLTAILGIGGVVGIDIAERGSSYLIAEWGYPNIGIVIGVTEAAGPDTVMLDYREIGAAAEPAVSYVGVDRIPHTVADSFGDFLEGLVSCDDFD